MIQNFSSSNLKLEFAEIFLYKILNFNENDEKYRYLLIRDQVSTNSTSSVTDTEKILKDLNRYIECYLFTAMSSLDALAYELFEKFDLEKPRRVYITTFGPERIEKNNKIKEVCHDLENKNAKILETIQNFLLDNDFKCFKGYRDFVAHKSILNRELSFDTKQTIYESFSVLKRPILLPRIIEGKLDKEEIDLIKWLKDFHKKLKKLHDEIKNKL